jgi:hypothetical protein
MMHMIYPAGPKVWWDSGVEVGEVDSEADFILVLMTER